MSGKAASSSGAAAGAAASEALQAELRALNITDSDDNLRTREFGQMDKVCMQRFPNNLHSCGDESN